MDLDAIAKELKAAAVNLRERIVMGFIWEETKKEYVEKKEMK